MMRRPFAIPFGVGLLCLLAVILLPLVGTLLGIGRYTSSQLEQAVLAARSQALESTISTLADQGFQRFANTQQALADSGVYADAAAVMTRHDAPGRLALVNMLKRHPNMAAGYVGFGDGGFLYAAQLDRLADVRRQEIGAPQNAVTGIRTIEGDGDGRVDRWAFLDANGAEVVGTPWHPQDYDPRERSWFTEALGSGRPVITEPYTFAGAGGIGVTIATPLPDGSAVIGADLTLAAVSRLLVAHKVTPSSLIVVATDSGGVLARTDLQSASMRGDVVGWALAEVRALAGRGGEAATVTRSMAGTEIRLEARALAPALGRRLYLAVAAPVAELTAETGALIRRSAIVAAVAVLLALAGGAFAARQMSAPLSRIANKTDHFRRLDFSDASRVASRVSEIDRLDQAVEQMRGGLEQFGRYVPRQLVQRVIESPAGAVIGGARQPVTVLITDIAGFSQTAEAMEPEQLVERLSKYLESLGGVVMDHGGTIDKYIGDSIMAIWNAPSDDADHVGRACRAALAAAHASERLESKWTQRGRAVFRTRCGLHTGMAIVGNIGSLDRMNYTVVGAVPNVASRIEALNKVYGTQILASGQVAEAARDAFIWREVDMVVPAGMTRMLQVYEPMAARSPEAAADQALIEAFVERWRVALAAYRRGDVAVAGEAFRALAAEDPNDGPCRTFVARCEMLLKDGVPDDWDGVTVFREK
ncbi:adenylate/guanylate cyclase domain-containing protein [Vineibacter terrae]|nr:adenylate/guanylate cyclase domain-containing protein [Vineibacter terrae]